VRTVEGGLCAAAALIVAAALADPASASIALVQKGTLASGGGSSVTATLPSATTSGDLLVAVLEDVNSGCGFDSYSGPAGWVQATTAVCRGGLGVGPGPLEIWYDPNVSAGTTSVTFNTGSAGANSLAQLSEWSGVAKTSPLAQSGTGASALPGSSLSVSTSTSIASVGELAVTGFDTSSGLSSFSAGSGWTSLISSPGSGFDSDYIVNPPTGSALTETGTSSPQTTYGAAIAAFAPACAGGSLTVKAPSTTSFPGVSLNGYVRSSPSSLAVTVDDESGSGSGWNLDATSTTLTSGGFTLPTSATTITSASAVAGSGNCSMPTNAIGYPITLPAAASAPAAVSLYDAAAHTGAGPVNVTFNTNVSVPGSAHAGAFASTWTLTLASGP